MRCGREETRLFDTATRWGCAVMYNSNTNKLARRARRNNTHMHKYTPVRVHTLKLKRQAFLPPCEACVLSELRCRLDLCESINMKKKNVFLAKKKKTQLSQKTLRSFFKRFLKYCCITFFKTTNSIWLKADRKRGWLPFRHWESI